MPSFSRSVLGWGTPCSAAMAVWLITGCSGSTSSTNTGNSTISVPSLSVNDPVGQGYTITAVAGDGTALTYQVAAGGAGGTVTPAGLYTPPSDITQGKTADTVVITSGGGQRQQVTINLQLAAIVTPSSATASVTGALPGGAAVPANSQVQFTATVAGDPQNRVQWTASAGSISQSGLYTAPASATNGSPVTVTVTPTATNPSGTRIATKAATALVTLQSASATIPIQ